MLAREVQVIAIVGGTVTALVLVIVRGVVVRGGGRAGGDRVLEAATVAVNAVGIAIAAVLVIDIVGGGVAVAQVGNGCCVRAAHGDRALGSCRGAATHGVRIASQHALVCSATTLPASPGLHALLHSSRPVALLIGRR